MVAQTKHVPFENGRRNFRARVARFVLLIWFVFVSVSVVCVCVVYALYCSIDLSWAMVFLLLFVVSKRSQNVYVIFIRID